MGLARSEQRRRRRYVEVYTERFGRVPRSTPEFTPCRPEVTR